MIKFRLSLPMQLALIFLLFGILWILLSDLLSMNIAHNSLSFLSRVQTYKGVIFMFIGAIFIFIVSRRIILRQQALQQELNDERIRYKNELGLEVFNAQERERKKIGEELHDNINQVLATTKLYLELARENPSMQGDMILRSSENISVVIAELRKLSKSLSPPSLGDLGLVPSIEDLLNSILHASKLQVSFFHDEFNEDSIDNEKKLTVYRIIQEQMNNILRHANAHDVTIELKNNESHLNLTISDDGVGFDPDVPFTGIGLKNIKNRAKLYNGTMHIDTAPGEGAVLHVRIEI